MKSRIVLALALAASGIISGCTSYYKVTDPRTSTVYYTETISRQQSGSVMFKDARSGEVVTLPASAILEIPKEQYEVGQHDTPTTRPS